MTKFEEYLKKELEPYVERIKEYLINKPEMVEGTECFDFYITIQTEAPYYPYGLKTLNKEEREKYGTFLLELDEICELVEPFEDCTEADKRLLELMKKYGYM